MEIFYDRTEDFHQNMHDKIEGKMGYLIKLRIILEKSHINLQAYKQNYQIIETEVKTFSDQTIDFV